MNRVCRTPYSATIALALVVLLASVAVAEEPLVLLDLPAEGPPSNLGAWLQGELGGEALRVHWPDPGERVRLADGPECLVTWSQPNRPAGSVKQLRAQVRSGGGMVYVIGAGDRHIRQARSLWGPIDVNIQPQKGVGASDARWAAHPLTAGGDSIGAVIAGSSISGSGGSPLIRAGGLTVAMAFDWGPMGRAVLLDQSVLFDQLHEANPRPAMRDLLVRAVTWAAGADLSEPAVVVDRPPVPPVGELIGETSVTAPEFDRAFVNLPQGRDHWKDIRPVVMDELERRGLDMRMPRVPEGEPVFTTERLDRTGLLVFGTDREEVHWTESITIGRYFEQGGRILCIPHARRRTQERMMGLNDLLSQLRITASLGRPRGQVEFVEHPITGRMRGSDDLTVPAGVQIWGPLTSPVATARNRSLVSTYERGEGRIVLIDGELLRLTEERNRPHRDVLTLLRRSLDWLLGDL